MIDHEFTGFQQDKIKILLDGKELGVFKVKFGKDEADKAKLEAQRFNKVLAEYFDQTQTSTSGSGGGGSADGF